AEKELESPPEPKSEADEAFSAELQAALRFTPFPEYDISMSLELNPQIPTGEPATPGEAVSAQQDVPSPASEEDTPSRQTARLYFGAKPFGSDLTGIEQWAPGEEPILIAPRPPVDPDIKLSLQNPTAAESRSEERVDGKGGETVAGKGEVT